MISVFKQNRGDYFIKIKVCIHKIVLEKCLHPMWHDQLGRKAIINK